MSWLSLKPCDATHLKIYPPLILIFHVPGCFCMKSSNLDIDTIFLTFLPLRHLALLMYNLSLWQIPSHKSLITPFAVFLSKLKVAFLWCEKLKSPYFLHAHIITKTDLVIWEYCKLPYAAEPIIHFRTLKTSS